MFDFDNITVEKSMRANTGINESEKDAMRHARDAESAVPSKGFFLPIDDKGMPVAIQFKSDRIYPYDAAWHDSKNGADKAAIATIRRKYKLYCEALGLGSGKLKKAIVRVNDQRFIAFYENRND